MNEEFQKFQEEMARFASVFYPETDRSAVIIGASQIDIELERLISKALCQKAEKKDELFENERCLGTLSAKINMAFRLGLIDPKLRSLLHIFRKIRNDMSHQVFDCSLDQQPHSNRIRELEKESSKEQEYEQGLKLFPEEWKQSNNSAVVKTFIVIALARLAALTYWMKPIYKLNEKYVRNNAPQEN